METNASRNTDTEVKKAVGEIPSDVSAQRVYGEAFIYDN